MPRVRSKQMTEKYKVKEKLGRGAFATVRRAINRADNMEFALKVVRKKGMDEYTLEALQSEVEIMRNISHKHIVKLYDLYDTPNHLHIIMDLLSGGELFDRIVDTGSFSEVAAAQVVRQIASALEYLHSNGIVHRDLKPENLLYESHDSNKIKLIDFGLARKTQAPLKTPCGSPAYVAPEVLERQPYGKEVDWWSLGVILYILLCGFPPFHDENNNLKLLYVKIKKGEYTFVSPFWDKISKEAKDLVSKLLTVDPKKRATYNHVINHPWLKNENQTPIKNCSRLKLYQLKRTFRRGVNSMIAIVKLLSLFKELENEMKSKKKRKQNKAKRKLLKPSKRQAAKESKKEGGEAEEKKEEEEILNLVEQKEQEPEPEEKVLG